MNIDLSFSEFVNRNPLLKKYCTPEQKSFLEKEAIHCIYKKDDLIFREYDTAFNVFFIYSGIVELWKEGIYTEKQVIRFAKNGDLLGCRGIVMENSQYQLSASALEDSKIYSVEKNVFAKILKENSELNSQILQTYTKELEKVETRLRDMANMNVREKVAEALLILYNTLATKEDNVALNIPLSRQTIADIAGTCKGRVIKQITEFRDENILIGNGKKITILRPDKLKEIVKKFHEIISFNMTTLLFIGAIS
jgi:CRP-like cAMP-binding protein